MDSNDISKLTDALLKKALGYSYEETIEEYAISEDDGEKLIKKKVTAKNIPPDIPAAKLLIEIFETNKQDMQSMSDSEIDEEIIRLQNILKTYKEDEDGS